MVNQIFKSWNTEEELSKEQVLHEDDCDCDDDGGGSNDNDDGDDDIMLT